MAAAAPTSWQTSPGNIVSVIVSFTTPAYVTLQLAPGVCSSQNSGVLALTLNSQNYACSQFPITIGFPPSTALSYAFQTNVAGSSNSKYTFNAVSGCGISTQSGTLTTGAVGSNCIVSATYNPYYYLTESIYPTGLGSLVPGSGWYVLNSIVSINTVPIGTNTFYGWTGTGAGSYSGVSASSTVTMSSPVSELANYATTSTSTSTTSTSTSTSTSTTSSTTTSTSIPVLVLSAKWSSNSATTQGQPETLNIMITGGSAPYSYNYLVINSVNSNILFSSIISNSVVSNSISFPLPTGYDDMGTIKFLANVVSADGQNVLSTNTMTISAIPVAPYTFTGGVLGNSGTTAKITVSMGSGYNTYFYMAASSARLVGTATGITANFITITSNTLHGSVYTNETVIGYNAPNGGGIYGNLISPTGYTTYNTAIMGLSANVIFNNNDLILSTTYASTNSLTFTPPTANTIGLLFYAMGGNIIKTVGVPAGCSGMANTNKNWVGVAAQNCIFTGTTALSTNVYPSSPTAYEANSMTVMLFPYYTVIFKDSITGGNILTNGGLQVTGNALSVIGMGTIQASPPSGHKFNSWSIDAANSANIVIGGASSNPTWIEVMGNAIVTASYT